MKILSVTGICTVTLLAKMLPIPPLASYTMVNGVKVFDMHIRASTTQFFSGVNTRTYGINSSVLGETIRIHDGDAVKIRYHNHLSEPTTMHGHGMHVPARMDGGPKNKIQPGTVWTASYTVKQDAATNWYHPHLMGKTAEQVYMGLAGLIIIDDDESDALALPKTYGVDDIPLIIQDKRFTAAKQIDYSPSRREIMRGYTSRTMMVNGAISPYVNVKDSMIRFRVLNGSNSSLYDIAFSDGRSFQQIATDGGFLESPVTLTHLLLSPGERAEIVVNFSGDLGGSLFLKETRQGINLVNIRVASAAPGIHTLPSHLKSLVKYRASDAIRSRSFLLNTVNGGMMGQMAINGKAMDINRIDVVVPVNDIEVWNIRNTMGMEHNFHIHGTHFMLLERDGSPYKVAANEKGYKDVVRIPPKSSVKVILKMEDYIDPYYGYMYHCHFLEHEDDGMMGQFSVVQNKRNPVFKWAPVITDDIMTLAPYPLPEGSITY
jgi:FtsP/CotA-like multicopper oxidase with cupredoxin domain